MEDVVIKVRDNGSYRVSGPVILVDAEDNVIPIPEGRGLALCRCGASKTKPFCDASHREVEFESVVRAPQAVGSEAR